ncbi:MAG TPA: ribonuclease J [Patescibacteria group bacterium]|nr:ribonuclease J [Patescibacteria group bacterium]
MSSLRIIPLGGMGNVTKNMFCYEYGDEMLLVDCGIGFPESSMLGVDVLIPDVTYVRNRLSEGAHIVGMCLTHGHDDHIAALPYIVPQLPDFEIYGSPLTAAFATARMEDAGITKEVHVMPYREQLHLGSFQIEFVHLTHSVPHTTHLLIDTPEGLVYHGSDFKFDLTPADGRWPDFGAIANAGERGVLCLLSDCLRVERTGWSPSESVLKDSFEREIVDCKGKFIVTLMSSNVDRIGILAKVAMEHDRKLVFVGRSVEQNVEIAQQLGVLKIPKSEIVYKKKMDQYGDDKLCVVVAGSQGQPGSSLVRAVFGEHPMLSVGPRDKVVFATDAIPGNETNVSQAIDELSRNGIDVAYSDISPGLHVSGHAAAQEQQLLIAMTNPKYLFPIGGDDRHRVEYRKMAERMGYRAGDVLLPKDGEVVEFENERAAKGETLALKSLMVDGLGVGDVGSAVLHDRKTMAEEGMVVIIISKDDIEVVSRGFVFMRTAKEIISAIKEETKAVVEQGGDEGEMRRSIEKKLTKRLDEMIGRTPLILPVFMKE